MATVRYSIQFLTMLLLVLPVAPAVLAHNGIVHGQPKEEKPVDTAPANESTDTPAESMVTGEESLSNVEVIPVEDELAASTSAPLNGVSIGFGDLLFGLMVVFPWLLIALRNQLNPSRGS